MHSSKLVTILRSFDRKELRRLERFLEQPYFFEAKQKRRVLNLFFLLRKYYPTFDQQEIKKKSIFAVLFPDQPYRLEKLNKIITRLLKVIRSFIALEFADSEEKKVQQLFTEARFYQQRSLDRYFLQSIQQLQSHQRKIAQKDKEYYYNEYLIDYQIAEHHSLFNQRKEDLNLLNTHQSLDWFYLVAKLEYACLILTQHISNVPLEVKNSLLILEAIQPLMDNGYAQEEPLINLLYQTFVLLQGNDDEKSGKQLRLLLNEYSPLIPFSQLVNMEAIYRSFYIREFNRGKLSDKELFELYCEHLEKGYLFRLGGLQPGLIKNLVTLGLRVKAHDWVWSFLQEYRKNIVGTDHPEEVYYFNLANYYFSLADYEKALESLRWNTGDIYYKIAARRLELKVYYEQVSPLLESRMDAFKVYIFRLSKKQLPPLPQEGNNNFINFLRQICHPTTRHSSTKVNSILAKLERMPTTVEREWLIEKLRALLG